jgi:hypothetical protein
MNDEAHKAASALIAVIDQRVMRELTGLPSMPNVSYTGETLAAPSSVPHLTTTKNETHR